MKKSNTRPQRAAPAVPDPIAIAEATSADWAQIAVPEDHPNQGWRQILFNWLAMFAGLGVVFALASLFSTPM